MFKIGTASNYTDLLDKLNAFLTSTGSAFGVAFTGAAQAGRLTDYSGGTDSVAELFAITATSATTFSVTGSVSGAVGTATVGTAFTSSKIAFTIQPATSGSYQPGDKFTVSTAPRWAAMRASAGAEYVWKAPGNDGNSAIYVGAKAYSSSAADYYNLKLSGFTSFNAALTFETQPGVTAIAPSLPLWQNAIPYWFVADGRRVLVLAKVSTTYQAAYLGFIEQYVSPASYPYPLFVGGSSYGTQRWSEQNQAASMFFTPLYSTYAQYTPASLRLPTGEWLSSLQGSVWPFSQTRTAQRENFDGSYPLFPATLYGSKELYGQLAGVSCTSGFGIGAEAIISTQQRDYIVVPNVFRNSTTDLAAFELN